MTHDTQFCVCTDVPIVPVGSPATRYLLLTSEPGAALEGEAPNRAGEFGKLRRKVL